MKYSKRDKIALFLLATMLFMQSVLFPITTYASKNTAEDAQRAAQEAAEAGAAVIGEAGDYSDGIFDGNDEEHNYDPTYMRWVGTEERACLLVYLVDYNTGVLEPGDYESIIYYTLDDAEENGSKYQWPKYVTETIPTTRVGNSNELSKDARFAYGGWTDGDIYNMPALVSFSSGEDSLKSWMEGSSGKVIDGHEFTNCEYIVYREFGSTGFKKVTPSSNGDPECLAVYEILTANSICGLGGKREEPVMSYKTIGTIGGAEKHVGAPGKFFGTLIGMARKAATYGINFDSDGATANYKWMQSVAKSCGIDNPEEITEYTKGNKNGKKGTKGVIV